MAKYHQFSAPISLYPQQVSQELMAAFVIGKQYMQEVSDRCRLCIMPEDTSISRHSMVATLYYYISQRPDIKRIIVISANAKLTNLTLPSLDCVGINHVLGKKILYDKNLAQQIAEVPGLKVLYDDTSLQSEGWYTHVHYVAMLPQTCTVLPVICPLDDMCYLAPLVDCCLEDPHTFVILMDSFAFRSYVDDTGKNDMQTLVYEPGGEILRFFNHYVTAYGWLFYALRVDKYPIPKEPERYVSLLVAG